jgi:hypothetical protein
MKGRHRKGISMNGGSGLSGSSLFSGNNVSSNIMSFMSNKDLANLGRTSRQTRKVIQEYENTPKVDQRGLLDLSDDEILENYITMIDQGYRFKPKTVNINYGVPLRTSSGMDLIPEGTKYVHFTGNSVGKDYEYIIYPFTNDMFPKSVEKIYFSYDIYTRNDGAREGIKALSKVAPFEVLVRRTGEKFNENGEVAVFEEDKSMEEVDEEMEYDRDDDS